MPEFFDNTKIGAYKRCPRSYYFRHVRHWAREKISINLAFGGAWHEVLDKLYPDMYAGTDAKEIVERGLDIFTAYMAENGFPPNAFDLETIHTPGLFSEMLFNYIKARRHLFRETELLATERPFAVPLGESTDIYYIGRHDKRILWKDKVYVVEHKTTSSYSKASKISPRYIESFSPNGQIDGYAYSGRIIYGEVFKGVLVDIALVHKLVHDGFQIVPIERQMSMLNSWLWETIRWADQIVDEMRVYRAIKDRDVPFLMCFPKNTEQCSMYAGCVWKDLCRSVANPESLTDPPDGFIEQVWEPFDLEKIKAIINNGG